MLPGGKLFNLLVPKPLWERWQKEIGCLRGTDWRFLGRVGQQAGARHPILLSKPHKLTQIPLALPIFVTQEEPPLCPRVELHSIFCTSSGFWFLQFYVFQIPLPLITPYSQHHIQKCSKFSSLTLPSASSSPSHHLISEGLASGQQVLPVPPHWAASGAFTSLHPFI